MGNSGRLWFLGLGVFLFSCAGIKDWDRYEKYQADRNFSRQKYEEKLLEERVKKKMEKGEDLYEKEVKKAIVSLLREPPAPVKAPDTVLRVLILPYVSQDGALNTAKYVFLRVEEGRWILGDYLIGGKEGVKLLTPLKEGGKDEGK
ncbi:MAG TPA: hypothetical protein ENJ61_00295 [Aquifex aeolicus]|uniref:Lipoprotein n=1 Tax=Aquifex aeolicus TaxID=63363 RepID=A0A7C5L3Y8_AQUAO|nr:hypothetical protein [Aquifex aeolicus]